MNTPAFLKRILRAITPPADARDRRKAKDVAAAWKELLSERGEVSGAAIARDALAAYLALPDSALPAFIDLLVSDFGPDPTVIHAAGNAYRTEASAVNLVALQRAVESPRQELFRRLNMAPGGTVALVALRARVLAQIKLHPDWQVIDADLGHLLGSWFNRGFLTLARIDWHTPAIVLEKIIQYEAVHAITSWTDLRRRLEADRRCFGYFHPALPDEPLVFIEVALVRGMSAAVQPLLDVTTPVTDPAQADTAIFYSITSCQPGLRGISFGNLLIKQVVHELRREFPRLGTFATLSPVPGFRGWLRRSADGAPADAPDTRIADVNTAIAEPDWHEQPSQTERLKAPLMALCARYLLEAKQGTEPADAVARFHLGNGARLERLNWLADTSTEGMKRSAGLMVNYLYRIDEVEENHEAYVREHRVVASHGIRRLARDGERESKPA